MKTNQPFIKEFNIEDVVKVHSTNEEIIYEDKDGFFFLIKQGDIRKFLELERIAKEKDLILDGETLSDLGRNKNGYTLPGEPIALIISFLAENITFRNYFIKKGSDIFNYSIIDTSEIYSPISYDAEVVVSEEGKMSLTLKRI